MMLTVALLAFLFQLTELVRERGDERRVSGWKLAGLFLLGVMMSALDRQGFFYLVLATAIVGIIWAKKSIQMARVRSTHLGVLLASLCSVAAAVLYNNVLAPRIILSTNGYWPDFTYQEVPFSRLDWNLVSAALQMSRAQVSYFFGNAPFFVVCLLCALIWIGASWDRSRRADWSVTKLLTSDVLVVSLISFGALVALLGLMILRHPPVFSIPDHSLWYYTLTIDAGLLFGTTLCVSQLDGPHGVRGKPMVYVVLLLMIASNAAHYGGQRKVMIDSQQWFGRQYVSSQTYLQQFLNGSPSWIRVGADGAIVELPIQQTGSGRRTTAERSRLI